MRNRAELRKEKGKLIATAAGRLAAMRKSWSSAQGSFLCHYTGIRLTETEPWPHPAYPVFDHSISRDPSSLVLTAHRINSMKADLDELDFKALVEVLADHFATRKPSQESMERIVYGQHPTRHRVSRS